MAARTFSFQVGTEGFGDVRDVTPQAREALGTWRQIVLVDRDNRPRARSFLVQVLGEGWED